jgi:hypothetical protein
MEEIKKKNAAEGRGTQRFIPDGWKRYSPKQIPMARAVFTI